MPQVWEETESIFTLLLRIYALKERFRSCIAHAQLFGQKWLQGTGPAAPDQKRYSRESVREGERERERASESKNKDKRGFARTVSSCEVFYGLACSTKANCLTWYIYYILWVHDMASGSGSRVLSPLMGPFIGSKALIQAILQTSSKP